MKMKPSLCAALVLTGLATHAHAHECGEFTIADMNWNSASLMAHVDQFILNNGYGCEADLIPGDTVPTGTSMIEKGQPDVAPELWTNGIKEALDHGVEEKRLRYAGNSLTDGGEEGFWVPAYLVEQYPEMATIEGVIKHKTLFEHPESNDQFAFYTCPAGWTCQITAGHLFDALGLEEHDFDKVDPGSGAALAGILAKNYEREKPWFGYYWSPTPVLGKYDMVMVDFGSGADVDEYRNCTTQPDCETPKVTMYPPSPVHTVTTEQFAVAEPSAFEYLSNRGYSNQLMSKMLAWMEDEQADAEDAMYYFLETYPEVWKGWVSSDIAEKVESAI
ncbi:ABC transporter substrate-binding protein [Vibrio astriarenae]|uniref:ABC transporter substrate-binding protein n=1 Tax=Vibrio astriarenae TaxID=1481923 RepID=UPI0037368FF9